MMTDADEQLVRVLLTSSGLDSMLALADLYEEKSDNQNLIRNIRLNAQWAQLLLPEWRRLSNPLLELKPRIYASGSVGSVTVSACRTAKLIKIHTSTNLWRGKFGYSAFNMKLNPKVMLEIDRLHNWIVFRNKINRIVTFYEQSM